MGVLPCSRKGCSSIMCDTYVPDVGYICNECQEEFKNFINSIEENSSLTEGKIKKYLKEFMSTEKGEFEGGEEMGVDDFFSKHSR